MDNVLHIVNDTIANTLQPCFRVSIVFDTETLLLSLDCFSLTSAQNPKQIVQIFVMNLKISNYQQWYRYHSSNCRSIAAT